MIVGKDICYRVGKKEILTNVNFQIDKGEILGLLGPSGAGKTTLINNLIGQASPQSGSIKKLGREIPYSGYYSEIGYMMQDSTLYSNLSVWDNIIFFGELFNVKNLHEKAKDKLVFAKLNGHEDKMVKNLSGGMKRRLSLAITLLHDPKVIFLDEPTVGIDPVLREFFWEEFIRLKEKGCSIVVTTHLLSDASRCDKILIIKDGTDVAYGKIEELKNKFTASSLEEVYIKASY